MSYYSSPESINFEKLRDLDRGIEIRKAPPAPIERIKSIGHTVIGFWADRIYDAAHAVHELAHNAIENAHVKRAYQESLGKLTLIASNPEVTEVPEGMPSIFTNDSSAYDLDTYVDYAAQDYVQSQKRHLELVHSTPPDDAA